MANTSTVVKVTFPIQPTSFFDTAGALDQRYKGYHGLVSAGKHLLTDLKDIEWKNTFKVTPVPVIWQRKDQQLPLVFCVVHRKTPTLATLHSAILDALCEAVPSKKRDEWKAVLPTLFDVTTCFLITNPESKSINFKQAAERVTTLFSGWGFDMDAVVDQLGVIPTADTACVYFKEPTSDNYTNPPIHELVPPSQFKQFLAMISVFQHKSWDKPVTAISKTVVNHVHFHYFFVGNVRFMVVI
jgi:hypothetical protein